MKETKKDQFDKKLADIILIKPLYFLFFKPTEKLLIYWGVKYIKNPNHKFGSNIPTEHYYYIFDKKTVKKPLLFYPIAFLIYFISMCCVFIYYTFLFTLPLFLVLPVNQWTNLDNIITILGYSYYLLLAYLVLLKIWLYLIYLIIFIVVIGLVIWIIFFPPSFSAPSLSVQMDFIIFILIFIAIGVYTRR